VRRKSAAARELQESLRALMAAGTVRVRVETMRLSLVQEETSWTAKMSYLGARLIVKRTTMESSGTILRDLTLQTGGAEVMRAHSHPWNNIDDDGGGEAAGGATATTRRTHTSSEGEAEQQQQPPKPSSQQAPPKMSVEEASRLSENARQQRHRARKVILTFPRSKIVMLTHQAFALDNSTATVVLQPQVFYKFTSSFRDPIGVSTDRREYSKLREVLESLKLEAVGEGKPLPAADVLDEEQRPPPRRQFEKDERDGTPGFVLEPQLDIMGEATTTVLDWFLSHLDIDKKKLPEKVHVSLADPLETVLASACKISSGVDAVFEKASAEEE
jgi:hypothetical protein